jgi:DNA invertase Pin-like site-specific DNA recombinase
MKAGYVRGVYSSSEVRRMLDAFDHASCSEVVINARPQNNHDFRRLLEKLVPGGTLAVWALDCAAPTSSDLVQLVADLNGRRIRFESISEAFVVSADSILSPAMIADAIDRIRSPDVRPVRRLPRHRAVRPAPAARNEAAFLVASPAR